MLNRLLKVAAFGDCTVWDGNQFQILTTRLHKKS